MQRHAFRSVCGRTRPELEQVSDALRGCIRQFSTTQLREDDNKGPSKPASNRERSRTATTEINAFARSRSPVRLNPGPAGAPKVLDVKNLPKLSFRGRGGLRGGLRGGARGGSTLPPRLTSPLRDGGRSMRGRGGFGGRGGRGGRGRGAKKFTGRRKESDEDKDKERKPRVDEFARMDPDEQAFDDGFRFGMQTKYSPSLTLDSLTDFAVVAPSTTAGKTAAVVENLSVLGTADNVGTPQTFQARHYATEVEKNGLRFFADPQHKVAAEEYLQQQKSKSESAEGKGEGDSKAKSAEPIITDAEEAVRKVILQNAVKGQHETPKFASDPVGVSRSWHLRAETYTTKDVNTFETKLTSLLSKNAPKAGGKPAAGKEKAKAKA